MSSNGTSPAVLNTTKIARRIPPGYALDKFPSNQMEKVFVKQDVQRRAKQMGGERMIGGFLHVPFQDPEDGSIYLQQQGDLVAAKNGSQRRKSRKGPPSVVLANHLGKPRSRRHG